MNELQVGSRRYWQMVAAYVVVLLAAQSFMGLGIDKFKELWGLQALEYTAYMIVALGAAPVLWLGARVWRRCSVTERLWIGTALVIYGVGTVSARNPQERLHYLGYGLLAVLLYVGFSARPRNAIAASGTLPASPGVLHAAMPAAVLGFAVGLTDELLQILWPRRYFDWADVMINALAVGLGLLLAIPLSNGLRRSN